MMLAHPNESLMVARKEMVASPPAAPAELAYVARNLSETIATVGRIATATNEGETAAMCRLVAPRLREVAAMLAAGVGTPEGGSRGEVITTLSAAALIRVEAEEDSMGFAEAAGIAVAASQAIRALSRQVRNGVERGSWQMVNPSAVADMQALVESSQLMQAHASKAVISGASLGRRRTAVDPESSSPRPAASRAIQHEGTDHPDQPRREIS